MLSVRIRHFAWSDIEAIARVHRACEAVDHAGRNGDPASLERRWRRPGSSPEEECLVAEARGRVVGYALRWLVPGTSQCTVDGAVDPAWRRQGLGRRLIARTAQEARLAGASCVDLRTRDDEPVAAAFARGLGFQPVRVWHRMWMQPLRIPAYGFPPGFGWHYFRPHRDEAAYAEVVNETFADHWGIGRTSPEQVASQVSQPDFEPASIILGTRRAEIVGVCAARYLEREVGGQGYPTAHIGPVGVRANWRGEGLGHALVAACLRQCRRRRLEAAELDVDEANGVAMHVYDDCGFEPLFRTIWYRQEVGDTCQGGTRKQAQG